MSHNVIAEANHADLADVRTLMLQYQTWVNEALQLNLSFQSFHEELAALPGIYVKPLGNLWIARALQNHAPLGCIAVKPLDDSTCEMKRLWVADIAKGTGLGRALAQTSIRFARDAGYQTMKLDTLQRMPAAVSLYRSLGFADTPAYVHNPLPDVIYLALAL